MNLAGQRFFVDDCNSGRRLEVKFRFWNRKIFCPISEPKFCLSVPGFVNHDPGEPSVAVNFQKYVWSRGSFLLGTARHAAQHRATSRWLQIRILAGWGIASEINLAAELRQIGFAGKERQRRSPVGAFGDLGAAGRVIGRNIEPGVLAINQKELFFGRFVLPSHSTRSREVDDPGFGGYAAAAIRVPLEKFRFQCSRVLISRFERAANWIGIAG